MQLKNADARRLIFVFLAMLATGVLRAQESESADLEEPIDTSDVFTAKGGPDPYKLSDADLRERFSYLNSCVDMKLTGSVKAYIKGYVATKPEKAKIMLGKRLTYFPLFEQKMREYGIPLDLKYLAVVESALNPKAVSRVGATGLWQFMPATGSEYGLRTNSAVEERSDPVKSTDAAMRYLKDLYNQFGDWALALAAYNSGPTRVNNAIKKAGSRNFWSIQRFLPKETSNYVPAFIAATYICNYFQMHALEPYEPDYDEQLTNYIKVFEGLSFRAISEATGVEYKVIKALNPGFKRDYVPPTAAGHYVILPQRVMPAFVRYLNTIGSRSYSLENSETYVNSSMGDGRYWTSVVKAGANEHLDNFAYKIACSPEHLKSWNKLTVNYVTKGQEISIIRPVYVQKHTSGRIEAPKQENNRNNNTGKPQTAASKPAPGTYTPPASPKVVQYQFHTVQRNESLEDIARQYATTVETLRKLNGTDNIRFGMRLKIREF